MGMDVDAHIYHRVVFLYEVGRLVKVNTPTPMGNVPDYPAVCANQCPEATLDPHVSVYEDLDAEDTTKRFHFQAWEVGVKNSNRNPALCGATVLDMRKAAWFDVGDARGKVHFANACDECKERLVF
jgi:hypothetical protein